MFFDFLLLLMVLLIVREGKIPVEELAVLNGIPLFGVGPVFISRIYLFFIDAIFNTLNLRLKQSF